MTHHFGVGFLLGDGRIFQSFVGAIADSAIASALLGLIKSAVRQLNDLFNWDGDRYFSDPRENGPANRAGLSHQISVRDFKGAVADFIKDSAG